MNLLEYKTANEKIRRFLANKIRTHLKISITEVVFSFSNLNIDGHL